MPSSDVDTGVNFVFNLSSALLALVDSPPNPNSTLSSEIRQVLRDTFKAFEALRGRFEFDILWPRGKEVLVTKYVWVLRWSFD